MKKINRISWIAIITFFLASCGSTGKKEKEGALNNKKAEIEKLKNDKIKLDAKLRTLEIELAKSDTGASKTINAKLVSISPVVLQNFSHYLDLQGRVDAENISYITPRGMGGQVRAIFVKEGDNVKKGQLLLKLDDAIGRQNVVAMRQSMEAVKTQLALARTVYERQENLWKQNIGTEVQLLQAKSNVEGLQNQLKTMQENVKLAQEQLSQSNVYSNVSGVADEVNIHVGETFTGSPANGIKIVNTRDLKVVVDVPENYLSRVRKGTPVEITVPDINRNYSSKISLISQSISETSRGFIAEAKIPYDARLKPNLIAIARILDYSVPNAIAIPVNTLQTDEKGKFVLVASKEGDKLIARKRVIQLGELYGDKIEIKQGLKAGDNVITEGFQALYDGQPITIG